MKKSTLIAIAILLLITILFTAYQIIKKTKSLSQTPPTNTTMKTEMLPLIDKTTSNTQPQTPIKCESTIKQIDNKLLADDTIQE